MGALLTKIFSRSPKLQEFIDPIRQSGLPLESISDGELRAQATALASRVAGDALVDDPELLIDSQALANEAIRRLLGFTLHDVQLIGSLVVASGRIAEMQTGEGKTLVAICAAFIQSLTRNGVHVATTNDYLAARDYEIALPILNLLGTSCGLLDSKAPASQAREAYACDVTYGSGYQFGFDYLHDQIALRQQHSKSLGSSVADSIHGNSANVCNTRHRNFPMTIVDEADSVMIDEAMVPLVISEFNGDPESGDAYRLADEAIGDFVEDEHYEIDIRSTAISLTKNGKQRSHEFLRRKRTPELVRPWHQYVLNALQAHYRFQRDQHYVVVDGEVQIVDQNTGRIFPDRTWRDGLHQAVEAKEQVVVNPPQRSNARITRQRFFGFYDRVGGLTGTIAESAVEIQHFYGLDIQTIQPNVPNQRETIATRFFADHLAKVDAIVQSTAKYFQSRQPVLIGTTTIHQSKLVSQQLQSAGVPHQVLNGVQDQEESEIIASAGHAGSVLVATNMAGRGTDIKPCDEAIQNGGLHVIAFEHAKSKRIDRQLVGRAARQGNPGSCQFFVSADDDLLIRFAPKLSEQLRQRKTDNGEVDLDITQQIADLQDLIEASEFALRQKSVRGDKWLDRVRSTLH